MNHVKFIFKCAPKRHLVGEMVHFRKYFHLGKVQRMININLVKREFPEIFRVFISGCSSSGKTHFARNLLSEGLFKCSRVYYFHPDINETFPIDWEDTLDLPVVIKTNLPSQKDILSYPEYSCLVIDDLYTQASVSKDIDYLFRVLSSKKKLHVIIMTQRYFAEKGNSLNIRNSSNFHVLMTNSDARINHRVGHTMLLKNEIEIAEKANSMKLYPYIFIDRTNQGRVSDVQVYTEIFGPYKRAIYNSMICVILSEQDFKTQFEILDNSSAVKHGDSNKRQKLHKSPTSKRESSESSEDSSNSFYRSRFRERKNLNRKIDQALRRYKQRSIL